MSTKLLALAASHRADSLNRKLLAIAIAEAEKAGAQVTLLDYDRCEAPPYRGDGSSLPAGAAHLSEVLRAHDGLLLASPEYNWSIPGHLKGLIDWLSVDPTKPLNKRGALLMCASPSVRGGLLGLSHLSAPLAHLGMYVYPHLIAIGDAETQLTDKGIANAKEQRFLTQCIRDFVRVTKSAKE